MEKDQPGGGDIQGEPEKGRQQQNRGEGGEIQGMRDRQWKSEALSSETVMLNERRMSRRRVGRGMIMTSRMATTPTAMISSLCSSRSLPFGSTKAGDAFSAHRSSSFRRSFREGGRRRPGCRRPPGTGTKGWTGPDPRFYTAPGPRACFPPGESRGPWRFP